MAADPVSGEVATACFVSARAADGYERDRRRQTAWFREHLGLPFA